MPKKRPEVRKYLRIGLPALGVLAAFGVISRFTGPDYLPLRKLRLESRLEHVDEAALRRVVMPLSAAGLLGVELEKTREAIERLPWVASARVRRVWPDMLAVQIVEQEPLARWGRDGALVDRHGAIFFPAPETVPSELPLLVGPEGSVGEVLKGYGMVRLTLMPVGVEVRELSMDARRSWRLQLANGIEVIIGRDDVEARLRRFAAAYAKTLTGKAARIARIDLRYTNGFAVRWKDRQARTG